MLVGGQHDMKVSEGVSRRFRDSVFDQTVSVKTDIHIGLVSCLHKRLLRRQDRQLF